MHHLSLYYSRSKAMNNNNNNNDGMTTANERLYNLGNKNCVLLEVEEREKRQKSHKRRIRRTIHQEQEDIVIFS